MDKNKRVSTQQLENISRQLSERDKVILNTIRKFRYLTTNQIWQLYFNDSTNQTAARRAANRTLAKLSELGLISALQRRIGGVRAGSGSYVWSLAIAGMRLLDLDDKSKTSIRKRSFEPSPCFLEHTLAIAETYIQLELIKREHKNINIIKAEVEPNCWRSYLGESGVLTYLKPDLYIETSSGDFEDHWFFEIDLATEAPSRIMLKCRQYYRYYLNGAEQKTNGVFPLVVWIVPDKKRAESLQAHIAEEFKIKRADIFTVITPERLENLVCEGQ